MPPPLFLGHNPPHLGVTDHALAPRHDRSIKTQRVFLPPAPMSHRAKFASAAGATLGFIFNNTKGARIGYRLGNMAAKRKRAPTAPVARKRGKSTTWRAAPARKHARPFKRARRAPARARKTYKKKPGRRGSIADAIAKTGTSAFSIGSGPKLFSGFKRTQLPTTFLSTATQRCSVQVGEQCANLLPTWRIEPAAPGALVADTIYTGTNWVDGELLFRANRWLQTNQSPTLGQSNYGKNLTNKFVVNYLKFDFALRNMSNMDITLTLYDCVLRSNVSPNVYGSGEASHSIDPITDWSQGLNMNNQGTTGRVADINRPGQVPYSSTVFCKLYKIRKVTKKVLSSGEVHHHYVTVKPRQLFDSVVAQDGATVSSHGKYLPGISGFTMMTCFGSIVNEATTKERISTSAPALDVVTTTRASFASYTRERRNHLQFNGLAAKSTGEIYQGVLDDTDAIAQETAA